MLKKYVLPLVMAMITFVILVQNPIFAASLVAGQARETSSQENDSGTNKNGEINREVQTRKRDHTENLWSEAIKEKKSMPIISSSQVYQAIVENEEQKCNEEFVEVLQSTDVTRLDLRKPSGLNGEKADELLEGTGLEGLGKAFVEAERAYHVNAYYLMAHAAWESGWGSSKISQEKNNLFGYMAYDHNPYVNAHGFKNKADSIDKVARYVSENYLDENGEFYRGPHLSGMNINYATDRNWKKGIASVMVVLAVKTQRMNESRTA
ncbi:MAG TPA: glucosaminidase domain-containing protein [Bacillota bacterium]|nr:glucosaminidase domain-containing protein [Bacillota bacterium]